MADIVSKKDRSRIMASVKQKNTKPEMLVRSLLHKAGFRFRLHQKKLPGSPDIVLPKYKTVIFVHGCFWHQHEGCSKARRPSSNNEYWDKKLDENMVRDKQKSCQLVESGWNVITVWQCELKNSESLIETLKNKILKK